MKLNLLRWKQRLHEDEVQDLENLLQLSLVPVPPRTEYAHRLGQDLLRYSDSDLDVDPGVERRHVLLSIMMIFSAVVIVALGIRTLGALITSLNSSRTQAVNT
ncbi:MAG: hypothetical protein JW726_01215 [Anaerolineales bacterium]|nr:hypothetical protein [Anaerolineales bacterium]